MRKKIGLIWVTVLSIVMLTGCMDSSDNNDDYEKLRPVEGGLYIHNAASFQNEMALQPAGIALRLAILRAEAAAQDKLDDLNLVFVPGVGNVKMLLFGANTKITDNNGIYEIAYAGAGGMNPYDSYARLGTVRVFTGGRALEDTDAENGWSVSMVSDNLMVSGSRNVTLTSTGSTSIYRRGNGYEIGFTGGRSYIEKKFVSNWTGTFVWTPEKGDNLSFSNLKGSSFGFNGAASGSAFWTLNGTSTVNMDYAVADGKYDPSQIGSTHIAGGIETARLTNPADYDSAVYPSPEVRVAWTLKDKRLNYSVTYNGNTVEFTY